MEVRFTQSYPSTKAQRDCFRMTHGENLAENCMD
ncbi:unnamed protein product [Cuscuta epithymum]|uniref:Transposase putative helix-turn-helix domain-containing protein n=1 Tax=Cuscuta epithymum TaxID=186058 RepID=A0AAV0ESX8_9ASTE|nr:unnamed protein product [Cuscuta epithymum]